MRRKKDLDRSWIDELSKEEYLYYVNSATPYLPTVDGFPWVVDYSIRSPDEFVISGPLAGFRGSGKRFATPADALAWAQAHYGRARVRLAPECLVPQELLDAGIVGLKRWAVLVRRL